MFKLLVLIIFVLFIYRVQGICKSPPLEQGVPEEDQKTIVDQHNADRGLIMQGAVPGQPAGKNLKLLKWDANLAAAAQNISDTCVFGHVGVSDSRWSWVGQNIFEWGGKPPIPGSDWTSGVQAWFKEVTSYNYSTTSYNHYTQVVWGNTEYVGCGYTAFMSDEWHDDWNMKLYVCNYGPGGNIVGQGPYDLA